ncbi:MAG: transporter substrate-binding domain-containing protein [Sphingobacterium sp.]
MIYKVLKCRSICLFILLLISSTTAFVSAQETDTSSRLKIGVHLSPPFVMESGGQLTGMTIEFWEALAKELNLSYTYQKVSTFRELVQGAQTGQFDVAVSNLTITRERAMRIDFTQPWYDSGLRVMIDQNQKTGFFDVISGLDSAGHLRTYAWLALVILVTTLLLTFFDRKFDKNFPQAWPDGLAESFYQVMSITTSGKTTRKNLFGWKGKIFSALWLVCGVAVLAYVTSSVTSVMTTMSLTNQVYSVADLSRKNVGVVSGTISEEYAQRLRLHRISYRDIDEAVAALLDGKIAAIIDDAPILEYYVRKHPEETVAVVGPIFKPDKYGFGLKSGSELTQPLTVEILAAQERGLIADLHRKYFGRDH